LNYNEHTLIRRVRRALDVSTADKSEFQKTLNNIGQLLLAQRELRLKDALDKYLNPEPEDKKEELLEELRDELKEFRSTLDRTQLNKR